MSRGIVVAVLVVLAGCSGFAGAPSGGAPTDTLTPVPVPEDDRRTQAPASTPTGTETAGEPLVPGVTTERVTDPFALVNAHIVGITAASYRARKTTTVRYLNGTLRTREVTTAAVGTGAERYQLSNEVTGPEADSVQTPPGRFVIWTDGDRFLSVFRPHDGPPEYARIAPDRYLTQREYYSPPPERGELLALLSAFEIRPVEGRPGLSTPTGTVTPAGTATRPSTTAVTAETAATSATPATATTAGTPVTTTAPSTVGSTPRPIPAAGEGTATVGRTLVGYRLADTAFTGPSALEAVGPGTDARNASLTMFVDARGNIRWYTLSYTAVVAGERMQVTQRSRYDPGGVRVDRPDWYGEALAATNATATPVPVG